MSQWTNPQRYPKSHGRKPPAPKPHRSSGKSSSSASAPIIYALGAMYLFLPALLVGAIVWKALT